MYPIPTCQSWTVLWRSLSALSGQRKYSSESFSLLISAHSSRVLVVSNPAQVCIPFMFAWTEFGCFSYDHSQIDSNSALFKHPLESMCGFPSPIEAPSSYLSSLETKKKTWYGWIMWWQVAFKNKLYTLYCLLKLSQKPLKCLFILTDGSLENETPKAPRVD